jgi:uncharacterized protein YndB with AHSA1/START domain
MNTSKKAVITVKATINSPLEKVWEFWIQPNHIRNWNNASDDWFTPVAEIDLHIGGKFSSRMEAKDGSFGFDFSGVFTEVVSEQLLSYTLDDDREVKITFTGEGSKTHVIETFEAETENTVELQQMGWQSILNNFKQYVEKWSNSDFLYFEIKIKATSEQVFKTMFDKTKYKEWTSEFNETSHFIGSWEKGSKITFLGTDKDGNAGGMVSKIIENVPDKFVSIEHRGIIKNGKEITSGAETNEWVGALENYRFTQNNDFTLLEVELMSPEKINPAFKSYFMETWPKALSKLKQICES